MIRASGFPGGRAPRGKPFPSEREGRPLGKKSVEIIAAILFAAAFAALFAEARSYAGRSSYMPMAATGLGFVMCCLWALHEMRLPAGARRDTSGLSHGETRRLAVVLAAGALYVAGFAWLGFFTTTALIVPGLAALMGYRDWKVLLPAVIAFIAVLFVVFRLLLSVPLPDEALLILFRS